MSCLHHVAHHGHDIVAALGLGVCLVEVVERHVLDNVLLLVDLTLGEGDELLGLEVILSREGVGSEVRWGEGDRGRRLKMMMARLYS